MPHERIPLTLIERREACAETATNPPVHRSLPRRSRWAVASADFIEGLRGVRKGDPLRLLAEVFAVAADAELACVIGPHVVDPGGDAIAEDAFVVHAAHGRSTRPLDGLAFPAAGSVCGRAFATGRPFLVGRGDREAPRPESVLPEPVLPEPVLRESVLRESVLLGGSALVVPVTGAGDPGRPALTLTACRPPAALPFTPADLESAADFARLASAGLHLDQSGTDRARLAVLSDRDRIARELHDRVIQRVFAAGLAVQALGGMSTDPVLGQRLADEVGALDDVIAEIRTAIFALSMDPHPDRPGVRRRIL
ncbi:MAG TPA: histidine kinase, partial [Cryobacterium sp.]|nr:histidine kinase [Cryobacterium sp.]